ncbi:MAG TPA: L-2-hydroxyglutarate oxidase [Micromonosporaceae bacterium]|nr:L-2-hydroxyglutarate oxidase [Micromonosporaceae bacterium]
MADNQRYVVIGGGILGLAVAARIAGDRPGAAVTVVEKEDRWASHQTGRNSGVVHSGLYYKPGSYKATMCRRGAESITNFARDEGVAVQQCGKLVVATGPEDVPQLRVLAERGRLNGLKVRELEPAEAREIEPNVACVAALHVPETGIIDYRGVCDALVRRLASAGSDLRLSTRVVGVHHGASATSVETTRGDLIADVVVNCGGLHSDRLARLSGMIPGARIVPFRGEYFELREDRRHLIQALIYPVPDPSFPFLGVHLTRMIDGGVHAGPNAVLALAREGYNWRTVRPRELFGTLTYPGFWRLAARHGRTGMQEMRRSFSRHRFADSLRKLVPAIADDDLVPSAAGVRAQAVRRDGSLVDDFLIERDERVVHVLNAPSPAATSALEIAAHIASLLPE